MESKIFGNVYLEHLTGANSAMPVVQEVSGDELVKSLYKPSQELVDLLTEGKPGDYVSQDGKVIFRIR